MTSLYNLLIRRFLTKVPFKVWTINNGSANFPMSVNTEYVNNYGGIFWLLFDECAVWAVIRFGNKY